MSFEVRIGANARRDFDRHLTYFASHDDLWLRVDDLERDLLDRLDFITDNPRLRREIYPGVRHEALRVFHYHIRYRTYDDATFLDVFAILHQASDPGEVERRLR
jgi:plasmid stabilization system protein ParE